MKRIISFVLCLSMLFSMLPVSVFASDVEDSVIAETTPVTEAPQAPETAAPADTPETEAPAAPTVLAEETAAAAAETEAPTVPAETMAQEVSEEILSETIVCIPDMDLPSDEELFALYAEHTLYGTDISLLGTAAGETLTGNAKVAYDALVPVLREIANGQRSTSTISVGYSGEVSAQFPEASFSGDELNLLLNALLSDLPYALYWFDKTTGVALSLSVRNGNLTATFHFYVAANYSSTGETRTLLLDTGKTGAASTAAAKAQQIVDDYASASDYDKLVGYKDEICALTSYNTSAASSMNFSSNDDPWQLIYVFDGLQSTKVVCEGYSKAFQYLCDLSSFRGNVTCYEVTGTMQGGTGAGKHMWNIVSIGGKNYMADVTNSDFGTVGANGSLFLAGTPAADDGSYTISGVQYVYSDATTSLWGTGESSILNLASEDYDPETAVQEPSNSTTAPTSASELLAAVNAGGEVTVWANITVSEDMTLSSESVLSFADYASLTVTNGATLTLNLPVNINGAQLIVEEGATLVSNVDLTINNPQSNGGKAVFNGTFENNGSFWLNTGSTADINGYAISNGPIFVGFGGSSRLSINGQLDACAYLCVNEGGELNLSPGAKLNLLGTGGGYLDNQGRTFLNGDVYVEFMISSGARRDDDGNVVGADANIEIRGTVTGTGTSTIAVGEKGSISCYGPVTTAGEVVVEPNGAFWVDNIVTLSGPAPLTVNGYLHIDYFDEFATADGLLNLETTANVNGYLHVCDGGSLNVTNKAVLNIKNDENGCGYLDNQGNAWIHGTMNLDGLCTTGNEAVDSGYAEGSACLDIHGSLNGSETSSIGVLKGGSMSFYGPGTTSGEVIVEQGGVLWVDNVLTLNGPAPFIANGGVHVNYFNDSSTPTGTLNLNKVPHEEDGVTVDADVSVNGYLAVCQGAALNASETTVVKVLSNEAGRGHIDNQGTVNMKGALYQEGLFTTGAARDEQGNVIGSPATAVINGDIEITEAGQFSAYADGTINLGNVTNRGSLTADPGSKLVFGDNACLDNYGGYVNLAEGSYQSEGFSFMFNHYVDGNFGAVEGFPADRAYLHCYPDSVYAIKRLVTEFETGKYVDGTIQIESDFVIDEDITLPEGTGIMLIVTEGEAKPVLTIPAGVTVTNNGGIYVYENTTLAVEGTILGNAPVNNGGTIVESAPDPQTRFEQLLASENPVLTFDLTLERDAEINCDLVIAEGVTLTVPKGITLTVNNRIEVRGSLITKSGGKLVNNGTIANTSIGTVTLASKTYTAGNEFARVENAYADGVFGKVTGLAAKEQRMYMSVYQENDIQTAIDLMSSKGYKDLSMVLFADLTLEELTLPANVYLTVGELAPYTEVALTVNGTLTLESCSALIVQENSTLVLNGSSHNCGNVNVLGTLKLGDRVSFDNVGGSLDIPGNLECGEGSFVLNTMVDGILGSVSGVPYEHLGADVRAESSDDIYALFEQASPEQYCDITVITEKSMTLDRDLEIPEVGFINVLSRDGSPVTLTIAEEVAVTNNGYIYVVGAGAELVNNGYINSFGQLNAMEGGAVTLNGVLDIVGSAAIDGTLVNNAMIWIDNDASLEVADYVGASGSFNIQSQMDVGGTCASVTGIPVSEQTLCVEVSSQSDIDSALAYGEEKGYGWTILIITDSFKLSRNLTIPENCHFLMNPITDESGNVTPITFTIPENVTVTNNGYFEIPGNASVVIDGMWIGELPITWGGGSLTGGYFEMSQAEFEELLNSGVEDLWLNSQVVLESDLTIDGTLSIGSYGSITVPEGVTLTINGVLNISGTVTVDGTIENNFVIWVDTSGHLQVAEGGYVHNFAGYGVEAQRGSDGSCADITGVPTEYQALCCTVLEEHQIWETLDKAASEGYGVVTLGIGETICLSQDLTLPENVFVHMFPSQDEEGNVIPVTFTVPKNVTLTNYGYFSIPDNGTVVVDGNWRGNLPSLNGESAEFIVNGRLAFGQDELEALLEQGGEVTLNVPLVLNRDLTIPGGSTLTVTKGGKLTVPGGKTLTVEGELHVTNSVDKDGSGEAGLVLESGKLVNNGLIAVHDLGRMDVTNGTYEQAEWAELHRVYLGDDSDPEVPFLPSEILGVPMCCTTLIVDNVNSDVIRVALAIADWAESIGDPFRYVQLIVSNDLTLTEDLTIPESGGLRIESYAVETPASVTVPAGVTLYNNGLIEIGWNSKLVIEAGGALVGGQPTILDFGGEFITSDAYTEADFRADIEKAAQSGKELFLIHDITLTKDLTIPENVVITVGNNGYIRIPAGVTLTNNGQIWTKLFGGLKVEGGTLANNALIYNSDWGGTELINGQYIHGDVAKLYEVHYSNDPDYHYDSETNTTVGSKYAGSVIGIAPMYRTIVAKGCSEYNIREILNYCEGITTDGNYPELQINVTDGELYLTEDLVIPEYGLMTIENKGGGMGFVTVPEGVTVTNNGGIHITGEGQMEVLSGGKLVNSGDLEIGWAGTLIVRRNGVLQGNHPYCYDTGSEYINENTYDQTYLENLIAQAQENGDSFVVLSVPVTLERDLTIPSGFRLQITGRDNFLTIGEGATLYNEGTIICQMFGGLMNQGGRVVNSSEIHVLNWGTVDMWNGSYESWGGMVFNHHARYSDGYEEHATVVGFYPTDVTVLTGGDEDSILHELIDFIDNVSDNGICSPLTSNIMGDMVLSGDLYWPHYAVMNIPEGVTVTVPAGVTLVNDGGIWVEGRLIVEGQLDSSRQITARTPDCITGNVNGSIIIPGVELTHFLVGVSERIISPGGYTQLWIEEATEYAEVYGYRYRIVSGNATVFGMEEYVAAINDHVDIYSNWSENTDPILVEVAPIVGYDQDGNEICPGELTQTVTINVVDASANIWWSCSNWFYDEINGIGVYAGTKFTMGGFLYNSTNSEWLDGTARLEIQGANEYVTIKESTDGTVTITTDKKMTEATVLTITSVPDVTYGMVVAPFTMRIAIRPCVNKANLLLNGEVVTGKTVTFDLNRVVGQDENGADLLNRELWLDFVTDPADASGGIILSFDQTTYEPIYALSYKSSNEKVATVDEWGNVHFTGATGKVKITATAALSKKVTAAVTFNAVEMAQEIFPAENTVTQLIGGKGASYSVTDEAGKAINAKDVTWFLSDEWGNPIESSPYASIKNGKLTTKAVADPYDVYIMAKLAGTEDSAQLAEPICVTLYPAVSSINIVEPDGRLIKDWTIRWDFEDMAGADSYRLGWTAAPCEEAVRSVSWKSSKTAVAAIDDTGLVTPTGTPGTVKFTLTAVGLDGKKTTASVTYTFGTFTKELDMYANLPNGDRQYLEIGVEDNLVIYSGEAITFEAYSIPENVTTKGVSWSLYNAADKSYASISAKGVLKAKNVTNPQTIYVLAESKDGGIGYTIDVTILPKPVKVGTETKDALLIQNEIGEYVTKATLTMTPGTETWLYASDSVTWTSSNASIASIDSDGKLVTLKNGSVKITAKTDDGRKAEVTVKVGKLAQTIEIGTKKGAPLAVASGKALDLTALVTYTDGSTDNKVNWTVSHTGIAKIASSGKLTATKGLTEATVVDVYATSKDGQVEAWVTVEVLPLSTGVEIYGPFDAASSYDVDVSNTTQKWDMTTQGSTFYLYAGLFPYDAMQDVTWKSSSAQVASIDENGRVTCLKPGSVTITATAKDGSGKKASFKLTVNKTMAYLSLPETASVVAGKSLTLTKLDGYAIDTLASNKNLVWTLTDMDGNAVSKNVATLSNKGVLKADKRVTVPTEVIVRAEAADGSGLAAECVVTITPAK